LTDIRAVRHGGDDVVVIAEAGVNHNGDVGLAHDLIDVAADSGADYVKFQTFIPELLVAPKTAAAPYQRERGAASQSELLTALALGQDVWPELQAHAVEREIGFLSTPFDIASAEMLVEMGVAALKVSSGELTNLPFLRSVASLGVPMLVSTGMGDAAEVEAAHEASSAAPFLAFFHCVSSYPAPVEQCNLLAIPKLVDLLRVPVGWSDHTEDADSALVAASLGARLFEKHFTLDRAMEGPDHAASLEPDQLTDYVDRLRSVPVMLGDGVKRRMPAETQNAPLVRRSWHAVRDIPAGHILEEVDVIALRPEGGVSPAVPLVGAVVKSPIGAGEPIFESALDR
jgi:N,N'-diacetyllegionaminate synthase